jgi:membrane-bound serine protease (ClpP class)
MLWRILPQSALGRGLTLETELRAADGFGSEPSGAGAWLGRMGRATTPLRPAGIAEIEGQRVDVVSNGELIEAGATVVVSRADGNRIVVQRHPVDS